MGDGLPTQLGRHDEFADVSVWDEETAARWVRQLDERAEAPDQRALRTHVVGVLEIAPGETVVDVGCGTGALLVDIAGAVGASGRAIGVEPQPRLAARARERVGDGVEVVEGRGDSLPLPDESVDVALAATVLTHLPLDVAKATIAEMARVVRPGGRIGAVEQDCDTWSIDHPDRELTRRIVAFNSEQRSADGWRGRQLRRLFLDAGLGARVTVFVHVDPPDGSYLYSLGERIAVAAADAGVVSSEEAGHWVDRLRESAQGRRFFSSINYVVCCGSRANAGSGTTGAGF